MCSEYMHSKYYKFFMWNLGEHKQNKCKIIAVSRKFLQNVAKILQINCCPEKVMVWGIKKLQNSYLKKIYGWVKKIKNNFWLEKLILWSTNYKVTKFFCVQDFGVSLKQLFLGFRFLVFLYENFCCRTLFCNTPCKQNMILQYMILRTKEINWKFNVLTGLRRTYSNFRE